VVTVLTLAGFVHTCQEVGMRGAKLMLKLNNSQFYRLKADAKKLEQDVKSPRFQVLNSVKSQLKEFIPLIKDDIVEVDLLKGCIG
jgi:hypothetical protein